MLPANWEENQLAFASCQAFINALGELTSAHRSEIIVISPSVWSYSTHSVCHYSLVFIDFFSQPSFTWRCEGWLYKGIGVIRKEAMDVFVGN